MSRTRTQDNINVVPGTLTVDVHNNTQSNVYVGGRLYTPGTHVNQVIDTNGPASKEGTKGTITDEVGASSNYNTVTHTKYEWDCPEQTVSAKGSCNPVDPNVEVYSTARIGAGWAADRLPWVSMPGIESEMVAIATTKANPSRIDPSQFNLPQFIGELNELRQILVKGSASHLSLLSQLTGKVSKRKIARLTYGDIPRVFASADLSMKFGIEPLIADVKAVMRSVSELARLLDKLRNGEPFRTYGRTDERSTCSNSGTYSSDGTWELEATLHRKVVAWAKVRFTDPLSASVEDFRSLQRKVQVLASYYRLNSVARTTWELLPLSFVVDIFLDIGSTLDRLDATLIEFPFEVIDSGYSVKDVTKSYCTFRYGDCSVLRDYKSVEDFPVVRGTYTKTVYRRIACDLPWDSPAWEPPKVRFPTFGKVVTLLELALMFSSR